MAEDFHLIETDAEFERLVIRLRDAPRYAIDTEFHRERTYFPHVALVQIADEHGVSLVDALSVDLSPFAEILDGPGLAVMHAARQDMEVLELGCATIPSRLFDTQLAAGFLGFTSPSLSTLLERELGVRTGKGDRLTDWLKRPLTERQLSYAADDVAHLLQLHERLADQLEERGRSEWADAACEELRTDPRGPRDPEDAWRRIKEVRHLKGSRLALAQAVAGWRERRAAEMDLTPRFVLSDLGVVSVASSPPDTIEELKGLRGVDGRVLKGRGGEELLEIVRSSKGARPQGRTQPAAPELSSEVRPVVPLISAWVNQRARDLDLETALLATRHDLEELLRKNPDARLAKGWRAGDSRRADSTARCRRGRSRLRPGTRSGAGRQGSARSTCHEVIVTRVRSSAREQVADDRRAEDRYSDQGVASVAAPPPSGHQPRHSQERRRQQRHDGCDRRDLACLASEDQRQHRERRDGYHLAEEEPREEVGSVLRGDRAARS